MKMMSVGKENKYLCVYAGTEMMNTMQNKFPPGNRKMINKEILDNQEKRKKTKIDEREKEFTKN
jgi:hypothetical protein